MDEDSQEDFLTLEGSPIPSASCCKRDIYGNLKKNNNKEETSVGGKCRQKGSWEGGGCFIDFLLIAVIKNM